MAWLDALVAPLEAIRQELLQWRAGKNYEVSTTGQRVYLERLLNDLHDPAMRRIRVERGLFISSSHRFNRAEAAAGRCLYNRHEAAQVLFLYNKTEMIQTETGVDFVILVPFVPAQHPVDALRVRRKVEQYNIATKKFNINAH